MKTKAKRKTGILKKLRENRDALNAKISNMPTKELLEFLAKQKTVHTEKVLSGK